MKPLRVLISAYACEPERGSEPGDGWNVVRQIAREHEVWVITRADQRPAIESELSRRPCPRLHFVYHRLSGWVRPQSWDGPMAQLHYYCWQMAVYFVANRLHREIEFDLVHHVTYGKYWVPSFMAFLPIPFIWGLVGGGESTPRLFGKDFDLRARLYEGARDLARWVGEHDPFVRLTAKRSCLSLATTEQTAERLRVLGAHHIEILCKSALASTDVALLGELPAPTDEPIRLLSIGRLLHWKGFHLGVEAFALAGLSDHEYWVVGDGPEQSRLQALATARGVERNLKFFGALARSETLAKLGACHVLVHPSLHDSSGWVCLEAMAAGRPVICLDWGGPSTQVTAETGFKIPARDPQQAIRDMAEAMVRLARDPELVRRMGRAGRAHVMAEHHWDFRGEKLRQLYADVMGRSSPIDSGQGGRRSKVG